MTHQPSLCDAPVRVPDIRTPAPSSPGSASSRRAARAIDPHRPGQYRTILLALAACDRPISREELCARTGLRESSACARLSHGELRPLWVETVPDACRASSGLLVDGYVITPHGRARVGGGR